MEADEGHSADEAQPPSCIAPNANGGQDASLIFWLKGLAESYSSCILSSLQRMSLVFISLGYSCVHEAFVEQGIPVRFAEQSSCIKGGE
jgi:hypothetical protein